MHKLRVSLKAVILIISAYLLVCALAYLGFVTLHDNLVGWLILFFALGFGLGGPYLLWSDLRAEGVTHQEARDRSFWMILPGFMVVFYASPLEFLYLPAVLPRNLSFQIIGLVLIIGSLLLHAWARLALKGMYSSRLWVRTGHVLVQHGPYRFIRHPAYLAYLFMGLGIGLGFSSLAGVLAVPLLLLPGLVYRMYAEEKVLVAEFGDQYLQYSRRAQRLIPGIW